MPRVSDQPAWFVPWCEATPLRPDHLVVRLALEADRIERLRAKARTYRRLHEEGAFDRLVSGPVLPVFLVLKETRARSIAAAWQEHYPGGQAVIATERTTYHRLYGAVAGTYWTLHRNPLETTSLLPMLLPSPDAWPRLLEAGEPIAFRADS